MRALSKSLFSGGIGLSRRKRKQDIEEEPVMDLKDFFKFLEVVEKGSREASEEEKNILENFKDLIYDLDQCVITGSAVLNYRIGRQNQANDLDFFITDTVKNKNTLNEFFNSNHHKEALSKFRVKHLPKDDRLHFKYGNYHNTTVHEDYSFVKLDSKMDTFRFTYGSEKDQPFSLNFIFVSRLTDDERKLVGNKERTTSSLYDHSFINHKGKLNIADFVFGGKAILDDDVLRLGDIFPRGLPLHIIHDAFDFEELKYVYSFELQQAIPSFMAAKTLLKRFKAEALELKERDKISENAFTKVEQKVDNHISLFEKQNKEFLELTSDIENLTISTRIIPENAYNKIHYDVLAQLEGISLESIFKSGPVIDALKEAAQAFNNVTARIPKYEARGFRIVDPKNFIADLQTYINLYTTYVSQHQNINNIVKRSSLLSGKREDTQRIKLLRSSWKMMQELIDKEGIKVMKESLPQAPTEIVEPEVIHGTAKVVAL